MIKKMYSTILLRILNYDKAVVKKIMKILQFLLMFLISFVHGGKVLFYIPFASKSVKITFTPILEKLSE